LNLGITKKVGFSDGEEAFHRRAKTDFMAGKTPLVTGNKTATADRLLVVEAIDHEPIVHVIEVRQEGSCMIAHHRPSMAIPVPLFMAIGTARRYMPANFVSVFSTARELANARYQPRNTCDG
jgi:hypothetical protein